MKTNTKPERTPYLADGEFVIFKFGGHQWRVKFRKRSYRDRNKKSRMYVDLPEDANDTLFDNLAKRDRGGDSDELKARRKLMLGVAHEAHENLGHDSKGIKYSALAGCTMCPCSPGIVMNHDYGGEFFVVSRSTIRARIDAGKEDAVDSAKHAVTEAKKTIRELERKLAAAKKNLPKVEAKVPEAKGALKTHRAMRKKQKAAEKKAA